MTSQSLICKIRLKFLEHEKEIKSSQRRSLQCLFFILFVVDLNGWQISLRIRRRRDLFNNLSIKHCDKSEKLKTILVKNV